jgi:hypothetical protein
VSDIALGSGQVLSTHPYHAVFISVFNVASFYKQYNTNTPPSLHLAGINTRENFSYNRVTDFGIAALKDDIAVIPLVAPLLPPLLGGDDGGVDTLRNTNTYQYTSAVCQVKMMMMMMRSRRKGQGREESVVTCMGS